MMLTRREKPELCVVDTTRENSTASSSPTQSPSQKKPRRRQFDFQDDDDDDDDDTEEAQNQNVAEAIYEEQVNLEVSQVMSAHRPLGPLATVLSRRCDLFPLSNSTVERYFSIAKRLDKQNMLPKTLATLFFNNPSCSVPYQKAEVEFWKYHFNSSREGLLSIQPVHSTFKIFMKKHESILETLGLKLHTRINAKDLKLRQVATQVIEDASEDGSADEVEEHNLTARKQNARKLLDGTGKMLATNNVPYSQVSTDMKFKIITKYLGDIPKLYRMLRNWLTSRGEYPTVMVSVTTEELNALIK